MIEMNRSMEVGTSIMALVGTAVVLLVRDIIRRLRYRNRSVVGTVVDTDACNVVFEYKIKDKVYKGTSKIIMFEGISLGDKVNLLVDKKEPTTIVKDYTYELFDKYTWFLFGIAALGGCLA